MNLAGLEGWVIETGLMVSALVLIILVIRRPFARLFGANAAYALWSLPLIRLVLPGLTIPSAWVPDGWLERETVIEPPRIESVSADTVFPLNSSQIANDATISQAGSVSVTGLILGVWIMIACVWLVFQLYQQSLFKAKLTSESAKPHKDIQAEIDLAAYQVGLKKPPQVRVSSAKVGPLVTGVMKPLIILPNDFSENFTPQQRNFALVHECAHIKRADLWVAFTALCFRALNWPNPLVHFASHKLRSDQEAACDAFVVKVTGGETAHSYAETLVKAVQNGGEFDPKLSHLALSLTDTDTEISKGD